MSDNRKGYIHAIHAGGHLVNALIKHKGGRGIETYSIYRSKSPKKAAKGPWSEQVDWDRAKYHAQKTITTSNEPCVII